MVNVKFNKDRDQFLKGDVVAASEENAKNLIQGGGCEITNDKPNLDGVKFNKRREEKIKKEIEALNKKAEELSK